VDGPDQCSGRIAWHARPVPGDDTVRVGAFVAHPRSAVVEGCAAARYVVCCRARKAGNGQPSGAPGAAIATAERGRPLWGGFTVASRSSSHSCSAAESAASTQLKGTTCRGHRTSATAARGPPLDHVVHAHLRLQEPTTIKDDDGNPLGEHPFDHSVFTGPGILCVRR
jgi:hypothetical protein